MLVPTRSVRRGSGNRIRIHVERRVPTTNTKNGISNTNSELSVFVRNLAKTIVLQAREINRLNDAIARISVELARFEESRSSNGMSTNMGAF